MDYLDHPPAGWFVLDVLRERSRSWDWGVLMVDYDPDHIESLFTRSAPPRSCFVRIPGKHRDRDAAWDAFEAMTATRH
jgi:hypothetical protein